MKESCAIHILPQARTLRAKRGEILSDVLIRNGIPLSLYCHKKGICGKCFVRVKGGPLPLLDSDEKALLERQILTPDHRLACRFTVQEAVTIDLPPESLRGEISILDTGITSPVLLDPAVKVFSLPSLPKPSLVSPLSSLDNLNNWLKIPRMNAPLTLHRRILSNRHQNSPPLWVTLYEGHEILEVETGEVAEGIYGLAIDIGTSTVVAELIDLLSAETLGRASVLNSQVSYGTDVVSRITFAFQNPDNLERLRDSIIHLLNTLIADVVEQCGVRRERILEAVVSGNTAMNHLFCGVNVDTLALSPFHAAFSSLPPLSAADLGMEIHSRAKVYIVPNIKSFVGGDISAGLAALRLANKRGNYLFVDLGTNGEIVLKKGRRFIATSTAAGPAFEGMSLSCGMLAVAGAVHKVEWKDNDFVLRTLNDLPAQGFCGTGLIDVLALCLSRGLIAPDGKITAPEKRIFLGESLSLTQQDIREMQLAIAAVKTGIRMILREYNVSLKQLGRLFVAGAFGTHLDIANARSLGLVPELPDEKIVFVGNAALAGARKLLLSAPERESVETLASQIEHISLATRNDFQEEFVRALELGPYSKV